MKLLKRITNALFPPNYACVACGREIFNGGYLCEDCRREMTFNNGATCPVCGRKTALPVLCPECKAEAPRFDCAVSPFVYDGRVRKLIISFKNGSAYLKDFLSASMLEKCRTFTDAEAVCFVPMTDRARRKRGYNQAELLAKEIAAGMQLPLVKAVKKVKNTSLQKYLSRKERADNLRSCFSADKAMVSGKVLIVVDDVLTTGATADAICSELKKRGAKKLYYVTAASVEYKREL